MFIPYVSTAFVPAHTMPDGLRQFAENQPLTPLIEAMRGLWMGHTPAGSTGHEALLAVVYCCAILAISVTGATWLFRNRSAS